MRTHLFTVKLVRVLVSLGMLISPLVGNLVLPARVVRADFTTDWFSPSANAADTGGDGNGFENNPTNAYADGGGRADSINNGVAGDQWGGAPDPTDRHQYSNFSISVPADATVVGIEVRLDWWLDAVGGDNSMSVELSSSGGQSWTSARTDTQETTSEHSVILGGPTDTWNQTWQPAHFSNSNFRVRLSSTASGSENVRDFRLDWVAVRVTYNRSPEAPTLVSPLNGAYTNDNTPYLDWNAATDPDNDTLHYAVSIDEGTWQSPTPDDTLTEYTAGTQAEGQRTWQVRAYDGRVYSYSPTWNFIVDTDTPDTPGFLYEGSPDQDYFPDLAYSMNINWGSAPDTGSGITYELQRRVNTGVWTTIYAGANTSYIDSNTRVDNDFIEYQVRARTGAGNYSGWRQSNGIRIDSSDPANVTGVGEGVTVGTDDDWSRDNVYWVYWNTVADTGSGISYELQRCVNGGLSGTCTSGWVTFTPSGQTCQAHPGRCWGDDPVGHSSGDTVRYQAHAVTGAGNPSPAWSAPSDGLTLDLQSPDSNVTTGGVYNPITWPGQIAGTASDGGSGVARVDITIYNSDATRWWDGGNWATGGPFWLTATGTTAWTYPFPTARLTDTHTYELQSRATDVAGNVETDYGTNQFTYAAGAPDAPVVTSTMHLDPNQWYNNNQPSFQWSEPNSPIGIAGYSIQLDQYPGTLPDKIQDTTQRTYDAATTPDGVWYFHVRAVDTTGQWGPAGHVRVQIDTATPQTPAGVTEESPDIDWDADGGITVYWSAVPNTGSGITYELSRSVNGGAYTFVVSTTDTSYAHNPGGYSDGNTVRYSVRAVNGVGLKGGARQSDGMTIDSSPVAAPAWVYEDAVAAPDRDYHNQANGAVAVRWAPVSDTGSGITYKLDKCVSVSGACTNPTDWVLVAQGLSATSYGDSGSYSDGLRVRYRVTAVNGVGMAGTPTASDGMLIDLDIPALPGWVYEGSSTTDWDYDYDGSFTVYWAEVATTGSGITYRLEKSINDGAWQLVAEGISGLSQADTNLEAQAPDGAVIKYRVTPINGAGTAGPYKLSDGITMDRETPAAPGWVYENNPDVDYDADGAVWVNWAPVANTGSGITYNLQKRLDGSPWFDLASDLTATSFNDPDTYGDQVFIEYQVQARNGVNRFSGWTRSDGVRVDTDTPAQVTGVGEGLVVNTDLDYVNVNSFVVYWTGVSATATGDWIRYTVERNINGGGWGVAATNVLATTWDDPQAYSNGDQALYRVTAVNGAGTSGAASAASDGITMDTGQPNSVIATNGYYNAVNWPDRVQGTASDDYSGVARVEVVIYDTNANLWWNGSAWAASGPFWLLATQTTNWYYPLTDANLTNGHAYDLQSRATDVAGNVEASLGINSFIFADSGPGAPVVSSSTHPNQTTWHNHNDPALSWTTPGGPAPIVGYSYALDQNPGTTPDAVADTTGNTASYGDVSDGTWYFHVRALDNAGVWGPAGHYALHIDTATPAAPASATEENPDVDYDYDGSVTVYWTAVPNTGSGIRYIVERQIGAGSWTVLSDTVQSTQYLDPSTGYADATVIHYRVSARNGVGLTGAATLSDGFTVDNDLPLTPAWVTENAPDPNDQDYDPDGSVRAYWAASNNTGSGLTYKLERQVTSLGVPGPWTLVAEGLTSNSYLDPVIHQDGDLIKYRVTAINGVGRFNPARESVDGITIDTDTPAAPAEVTENSPDIDWSLNGSVTVFWGSVGDTGSNITFRLEKQVNGSAWALVPGAGALPGGTTSFADSGTYNDGDVIRYRVRATNGAGLVGAWRESDGMTIDSSAVAAPGWVREENPDIDHDADGALTVYWAAVSNTGSGVTYRLEKQIGAGSWTVVAQGLAGTSYYDGQTQPDATVVHYRVTAVNGVGTVGSPTISDGVTIDTQNPAPPTSLGEGDVVGTDDVFDQDNTFWVFWTASADTGSGIAYDIQKSINGGAWVSATTGVAGTSWEDPVPYSNGDTVQYRIRAVNGAGLESAWSGGSSGITMDLVRPDSSVSTHGYYNAFNWPGHILGTSSDSGSDVAVVHLTIQRASNGEYWNGSSWQGSEAWLTATGTINWQYAFAPTDGETYDVRSRATDNADNVEITLGVNSFTYSSSGPQAPDISSPTHPNETVWYNNNAPTLNWTEPSSVAPVVGYSYVLDQNPGTTPDAVADTTARTVSYSGLADSVWYFHVRALDDADNWGPADHFAIHIDTATPAAPGRPTEESPDVDYDADGAFTVYWSAVANTGSGITYRLERELNSSGTWTLVISTTATNYAYSGSHPDGTFIRFRVRAVNGVGNTGAWSSLSDGVTIDSEVPSAPGYVREGVATDPDWDWDADGSYTVHWGTVANTGSGIQYRLYRRVSSGAWELLTTTGNTTYADSGTYPDNTLIEYQVIAVNGAGLVSAAATSDGIRIDSQVPATPASVTEGNPDVDWDYDGQFTVYWSAVANTGSGITYRLERNLNGAGWTIIATQAGVSYADNIGNTDGTTAQYRVTAINGVGLEGSPRVSDGVTVDSQAVQQPSWVREDSATDPDRDYHPNADGAITVYWASVTDTGSGIRYRLEKRVNGGAWAVVAQNLLGTSYPDSGSYADNDFIEYRVTAINGVLTESTPRVSDGMRIDLQTPAAPTTVGEGDTPGVDDDFDENNVFYVYWTAVPTTPSGITYSVERNRNSSGVWEPMVSGLTATQWEDPTAYSNGESVAYRVTAQTGAGRSSAASTPSDGLTLDFVQPGSAINTNGFYNNFSWPGSIQGTGNDDRSGVRFVHITIRRQSDSQYWTGATWGASTWLTATGTANWTYTFTPGDGQTYNVQSRSTDYADNVQSALGTSTFNYTSSGPGAPTISSPTHPNPALWYTNNSPTLNWTTPSSGSGIKGYSYVLDHTADTDPDLAADTTGNTRSYSNITDGLWYFHVRAVDNADNWGPSAHYAVRVDTIAPVAPAQVTEESPDETWDADGRITVYWSSVTDASPVTYVLERSTNNGVTWVPVATGIATTSYLDPVVHPHGTHLVYHVRAVDSVSLQSGWTQSNGVTVDSQTPAQPTGVGEGNVVGTDIAWDQDNTFYAFWNAVPNTGSGILYAIERSVNGGLWQTVQTNYAQTYWEDPQLFVDTNLIQYRITAVSGMGLTGTTSAASNGITMDFTVPDSAVGTSGTYGPGSWTGYITGTATDATSGVAQVQVTIQRTSDNQYWTGAAWQGSPAWLAATGTTAWSRAFTPVSGETYNVQSRATDAAGNMEVSYGVSTFTYTSSEPDSTVATNGLYVGAAWPGNINGTAAAPMAAVRFVDITILRTSDSQYYNGTTWGAGLTWLRATGTNAWSYSFTPADGQTYIVRSRVTDMVGNVEVVYGSGTFSYDLAAPVIQTVGVTSDRVYFYSPGLGADGGSVYFNSRAGEGAGQNLMVTVTYDEPNPSRMTGAPAFGDTPPADTAAPWTAQYSVEANAGTQSGVLFSVFDTLNLTDTASITFVEDNLAPSSSASIAADATNVSPIAVDWQASDSASGARLTRLWVKYQPMGTWTDTGLAMTGVSGSFDYTPTSGRGTYYFATVAEDNVGNVEPLPTGLGDDRIYFDNFPSNTTAVAPMYAIASPIVVTWTADAETQYTYLYYRFGDTGPFTMTNLPFSTERNGTFAFAPTQGDGHYYFTTVAIDDAGNVEPIPLPDGKTMTIYDTLPPSSTATSPDEWSGLDFTVEWTGDDTPLGSGIAYCDIQVKVGNGEWTDWITHTMAVSATWSGTYVGLPDETYHFRSRATDNAGHVEAWPSDSNGDTTTILHFPGSFPGKYKVYLPFIARGLDTTPKLPDLVVTGIAVTPPNPAAGQDVDVAVTIKNQGTADTSACFWIDLYINPTQLPITVNKGWFEAGSEGGLVWWQCGLKVGESTTLHFRDDTHYRADLSRFDGRFPAPRVYNLYAQVDSYNLETTYGVVYESNDQNNVYGLFPVTVGGSAESTGALGTMATPRARPNIPPGGTDH